MQVTPSSPGLAKQAPRRRRARRAALALLLLALPLGGVWGLTILDESREATRASSAIQTLKTIMAAQSEFRASRSGTLRYGTLDELCEAGFLDPQLVDESRGYRYSMPLSQTPEYTWGVVAEPTEPGERWFAAAHTAVVSMSREPIAFSEDGSLPRDLVGL